MATKAKTAGNTSSTGARVLEDVFSDALGLLAAGKRDEALAAFASLESAAAAAGKLALARAARMRIVVLEAVPQEAAPSSPGLEAQVFLNRQEPDTALPVLEKALSANDHNAHLLYLKALALAQKHQAEASAQVLQQAFRLDESLVFQFRNERDFDRVRSDAAFANFELV